MSLPNNNNGFGTSYTQPLRLRNTQNSADNFQELAHSNGAQIYKSVSYQVQAGTVAGTYYIYDNQNGANALQNLVITGIYLVNGDSAVTYTVRWVSSAGAVTTQALNVAANGLNASGTAVTQVLVNQIAVVTNATQSPNINSQIVITCLQLPTSTVNPSP